MLLKERNSFECVYEKFISKWKIFLRLFSYRCRENCRVSFSCEERSHETRVPYCRFIKGTTDFWVGFFSPFYTPTRASSFALLKPDTVTWRNFEPEVWPAICSLLSLPAPRVQVFNFGLKGRAKLRGTTPKGILSETKATPLPTPSPESYQTCPRCCIFPSTGCFFYTFLLPSRLSFFHSFIFHQRFPVDS